MTTRTNTPPLVVERLLEALAAPSALRDDIVGDLAAEFARRAERGGVSAARWWYCVEAGRAVPHLLWASVRRCSAREAGVLVGAAVGSYVIAMVVLVTVLAAIMGVIKGLGIAPDPSHYLVTRSIDIRLIGGTGIAVALGLLANWISKQRPAATALGAGLVWACLLGILNLGQGGLDGHVIINLAVFVTGATIGGLLHGLLARPPSRLA